MAFLHVAFLRMAFLRVGIPVYGIPAYGIPACGNPAYGNPACGIPAYGIPACGASKDGFPSPDDFSVQSEYNLNRKSIVLGTLGFSVKKKHNVSKLTINLLLQLVANLGHLDKPGAILN